MQIFIISALVDTMTVKIANHVFPYDTPAHNDASSHYQKFRRHSKKKKKKTPHFDYISPRCDLDLEDSQPIFRHYTPAHDNTPPYQVWLQKVERFKRYRPDKIRTHKPTEKRTHGQTNAVIPIYIPFPKLRGEGGGIE